MDSHLPHSGLPREIQANELLPPISRWTRIGSAVLLGTLSAAFTLATTLKYNVTVQAPATVRPVGDLRIVQAPITGTIDRITVQDNSVVKQGEAIAFINNSQLQTHQNQLQGKIRQSQRQLAQFQAEIRNQEAEGGSNIQEARANLELAQSQLSTAESLIGAGAIPRAELQEKRQSFSAAQAKLQQAQSAASRTGSELSRNQIELQTQIEQDQKELQQIETDLSKSIVRAPVSGTVLKLELRNPGQLLQSGDTIAQIVPSSASLVVKAQVAAQDIAKINVCRVEQVSACTTGRATIRVKKGHLL